MDWTAIILIIIGLFTTGLGSFKLLKKKKTSSPPAPATRAPIIHTPSEEAVDQLDLSIDTTKEKLEEIEQEQTHIQDTPPSTSKPDLDVAAWLKQKKNS